MKLVRCVFALLVFMTGGAHAVLMDFEEYRTPYELNCFGYVVEDAGFQIQFTPPPEELHPVGMCAATPLWRFHYGTAVGMFANNCRAVSTLSAVGGRRFALQSMDLQELNGDAPVSVTFFGLHSEGRTVTFTVNLNGTPEWERIEFPAEFKNVRQVSWQQGSEDCWVNRPHMFANIRVNVLGRD